MYSAVHHQGEVYDSTLAAIPFLLELAASPGVQDRGAVVELLTSIGGIELDGDDEPEPGAPGEEFEEAANYAMAAAAVASGAEVFIGLLADDDPGVRLTVPCALAMLHHEPARVLTLLRARLDAEWDADVRLALVEAVGRIALRHAELHTEAVRWLTGLLDPAHPAELRLAALTQLARCAPGSLPPDATATATALLRESAVGEGGASERGVRTADGSEAGADAVAAETPAREGGARAADAPGAQETGTSAKPLGETGPRQPTEPDRTADGDAEPHTGADELLYTLYAALGDRVDERIALLVGRLSSGDPAQRTDAVWMCHGLIRTWRGPYDELVRCVGAQLGHPEPRLRAAAASLLESLSALALPAADALAARLARDSADAAVREEAGEDRALIALTRLGDPRAVPALAAALEEPELPRDAAFAVPYLGAAAAPLVPLLRRRLARVELDETLFDLACPLLPALGALRAAEALPEVLRVLRGASARDGAWVMDSVLETALRTLAAFGPAALPAAPELRALLGSANPSVATAAARALWAVSGDADAAAVLALLLDLLAADGPHERRSAASALGCLGPRAATAAPALRALLAARERWLRMDAAMALWRVTGEARDSLPALAAAWEENRYGRVEVAECLTEMGPAAGPAVPLLRAELCRPRRHNVLDGGSGTHDIEQDERLLTLCRRALAGRG
ncbi:PBS lyase [Streptomyces sp. NPDC127084]|uniref:PBS lyase n=1 Tax=Streptomyces sp. NPDC127084 TaxID=3347133 RepID=UPI00365936A0